MKRTVYNTVIGLMLVCGLTMISTGAFAQGRRPATTSNNAAAAGNRSVATAPKQNAAVSNNSSRTTTTTVQRTTTTTTTTKPSTTVSGTVTNRTTTTTKPSSSVSTTTTSRSTSSNAGSRSSNNSSSSTNVRQNTGSTSGSTSTNVGHGNTSNSSTSVRQSNAGNRSATSNVSTTVVNTTTVRSKDSNNGSGVRPSVGSNGGNNNKGHTAPPAGRPSTDNPRPKVGGSVMNGSSTHIDYNTYRYNSSWRPRFDGDPFFNHYRYNSWSWNNPIRPSVRQYRPSTLWFYRPTVTINVSQYSSYPTIAGVLGLRWGTSFTNSLNYLYYNGYYIDGFMDNIVYLTDVQLFDLDWDDVMIRFDRHNNLDYVEFSYWTPTYDTTRFFWLYNELCSIYGRPVSYTNSMFSWYGGSGVGFVNLGLEYTSNDVCYTVLAFGS